MKYFTSCGVPAQPAELMKQGIALGALTGLDPLASGSPAIDRGTRLRTVTNGYCGLAPDLDAVEYGQELPYYRPRYQ